MTPPVDAEAPLGTRAVPQDFGKRARYRRGVVRLGQAERTATPLKGQKDRTGEALYATLRAGKTTGRHKETGPVIVLGRPFAADDVLAAKLLPGADGVEHPRSGGLLIDPEQEARELARAAVAFARGMLSPSRLEFDKELLELANRAAEQCAGREGEDVKSWAERLAREVGDATD